MELGEIEGPRGDDGSGVWRGWKVIRDCQEIGGELGPNNEGRDKS